MKINKVNIRKIVKIYLQSKPWHESIRLYKNASKYILFKKKPK